MFQRATALLLLPLAVNAASLKKETVKAWEDYIQAAEERVRACASEGKAFLWIDESSDRAAKVRKGETVVSAAGPAAAIEIPSGLIHDWIGAVFIANATLEQVLAVVTEYDRYKDIYRPAVIDSKSVALSDVEDRFSMRLANKSLFRKTALDTQYKATQFRVDERRRYTIAQTTRVQEIAGFGARDQQTLPEGEGAGLIWRLFGVTRFEERDGGVYLEIEAIALSRDVPASLRWLIDPIVRRVARASLITTLQQTRDAVQSSSGRMNRHVAERR